MVNGPITNTDLLDALLTSACSQYSVTFGWAPHNEPPTHGLQANRACYGSMMSHSRAKTDALGIVLREPTEHIRRAREWWEFITNPETSPWSDVAKTTHLKLLSSAKSNKTIGAVVVSNTDLPSVLLVNYMIGFRFPWYHPARWETYNYLRDEGVDIMTAMALSAWVSYNPKNKTQTLTRTGASSDHFLYGNLALHGTGAMQPEIWAKKAPVLTSERRAGPGIPNNHIWGATSNTTTAFLAKDNIISTESKERSPVKTVAIWGKKRIIHTTPNFEASKKLLDLCVRRMSDMMQTGTSTIRFNTQGETL